MLPTDADCERADLMPVLASGPAGDPLQDPLPLMDPELDLDELESLNDYF